MNTTILYAVVDTAHGTPFKVRLSDPLPRNVADDLFAAVYADNRYPEKRRDSLGRFARKIRPVTYPGWLAPWVKHGTLRPVRFFALRDVNDPDWPARAPKRNLTDQHATQYNR